MPPLTLMIKPASGRCNMHCRYCFYMDEMRHRSAPVPPPMTAQTLERLIRRAMLHAQGRLHLVFQGGEPTLAGKDFFRHLLALENAYRSSGLAVSHAMQTNGYDLDPQWCEIFREGRFLVGVSLDGTEALHDGSRRSLDGEPTYRRVLDGIRLLRAENIAYNVLCVVTEPMTNRAGEVFDALKEHAFLQFIPCLDALDGARAGWSLQSASYGRFLVELFDCYEQAFRRGEPVSIRTFDNWLAMLRGQPPDSCAMSGQCGSYYVIEADGSVYPCDFYAVDAWRLGNINDASFPRLEKSELARRFLAPLPLAQKCAACPWLRLCRGGCRREREPLSAGGAGVYRWCQGLQYFFSRRFTRLEALARRTPWPAGYPAFSHDPKSSK